MNTTPPTHASVAIIGGGFSGLLSALGLIMHLSPNSRHTVTIVEKTGHFGYGPAYGTQDPYHYLNVRAGNMGAFPDKPDDFFLWLQKHEEKWKSDFPHLILTPDSFVPRKLYGLYLQELLGSAKKLAAEKNISLTFIVDEAVDASSEADGKIRIEFSQGATLIADVMILATNLPSFQRFDVSTDLPENSYIENIWAPSPTGLLSQPSLSHLPTHSRIAVIGSGLTMVDAVMSLIEKGYPGEILALSKHGELPQSHLECREALPFDFNLADLPKKVLPLVHYVRRQIADAEKKGYDWRAVIDALRPFTIPLWESLPGEEKERFVRHVLSRWNKFRHRISPNVSAILLAHQKIGKLHVRAGRVSAINRTSSHIGITIVALPRNIEADYVLNCSGPQMNLRRTQNPLLKNLLGKKLILSHSLDKGLQVNEHYQALSDHPTTIYATGQLLFGQKLETVAVPELREQCAHIAKHLIFQILK